MENKRSKVLISILLVVLCLSVCVGLTYAYFTDSAKSSGNKIQAGNLKLDLKLYDKVDDEWISIKNTEDPVFNYEKWEPGYVDAKLLKIENLGDLAMQWEAKLVSTEAVSEFANAIEVYVQKSDAEIAYPADRAAALAWTKVGTLDQFINTANKLASGTFTAQGEAYYIGIAFYMPAEITDNTLQGKVLGAFDIQINATQLPYESDAFDENYDADATLPCGHYNTEILAAVPATCKDTGLTEGKKCVDCGAIVLAQQPTPVTDDHVESDWIIDIPAEEGIEGSRHTECTVCGVQIKQETIPALPTSIFTWQLNDDGKSYTVTGLKDAGTVADLVIPATYNDLPVTKIGVAAFDYDSAITSVTIPDSVATIGAHAFNSCDSLTSIDIPNSVTTIGKSAFEYCSGLTELTIGSGVTAIGDSAFKYCSGLTELTIPDSVISIGNEAFYCCYNLTGELIIPDSVTIIADSAFESCYNLTGLTIGNSVTTIGNDAFCDCHSLAGELIIPDSVTFIGDGAFHQCGDLTKLTMGDGVATIGDFAFYGCYDLKDITFGDSITTIGRYAFYQSGLAGELIIPNSVTTIGEYAFCSCYGLTDVTIPNSITTISDYTFSSCGGLTSIEIPNSVTTIGDSAFSDCNGLTSITIPDSVTSIGYRAFSYCDGLTEVVIPDSVTTIDNSAFYSCYNLKDLTIGNSVTTIDNYAFAYCSLTSVTIPDSVITIGDCAFYNCYLTELELGNHVTTIGEGAFDWCTRLTGELLIPESVTSIGIAAFRNCSGLTGFVVEDGNIAYQSINGDIYSIDGTVLVAYATGKADTSFTIPNGVTTIRDYAFYDARKLVNVTIPDGVTTIGRGAFEECFCLDELIIPNSVTTIGENAFANCYYLSRIFLSNSITKWGDHPFERTNDYILTVYAPFESAPSSWNIDWNCCGDSDLSYDHECDEFLPVVWNWTGEEYTYTFEVNGATPLSPVTSSLEITLPMPQNDGFLFMGWYDNAEFEGSPVNTLYYSPTKHTLYAKWMTGEEAFGQSTPMALYNVYTVDTAFIGQRLYFEFTPQASGTYIFIFKEDSYDYQYANLYNSAKNLIDSKDGYWVNGYFEISCELTANETYYLVTGFLSDTRTGSLSVSVTTKGENFEQAAKIEPDTLYTANIMMSGQKILYKFTPTIDGNYVFSSDGWEAVYGRLYDSNKNLLAYSDAELDGYISISYTMTAGETYYLEVGALWEWEATGSCKVMLVRQKTEAEQFEHAAQMELNKDYTVDIMVEGQKAYFVFTAPTSGHYSFWARSDEYLYLCGSLYNSNRECIDFSDDGDYGLMLQTYLVEGETCYLVAELNSWNESTGSFNVSVSISTRYSFVTNSDVVVEDMFSVDEIYLPTLKKQGAIFVGWYDNAEFTGKLLDPFYISATDCTLYAKWMTPEKCAEEAIVIEADRTYIANVTIAGEPIYYAFTAPTNGVYEFSLHENWHAYGCVYDTDLNIVYPDNYDEEDEGDSWIYRSLKAGKTYYFKVELARDAEIEPIYVTVVSPYTYSFETNGGDVIEPIVTAGSIVLPTPQKEGAIFLGWYDNAEFVGDEVPGWYRGTSDCTLYAKWLTKEEITVQATTLQLNTLYPTHITVPGQIVCFAFTPNRTGTYAFLSSGSCDTVGYLYDSNLRLIAENHYTEGVEYSNNFAVGYRLIEGETYYLVAELSLYFELGSFYITVEPAVCYDFVTNGGEAVESIVRNDIIYLPTPERGGDIFMGWYTNPEFTGEALIGTYVSATNCTLYAKWESLSELFAQADELKLDESQQVTITAGGQRGYYVFTPTESGSYTFYSSGYADTYGYLYDSSYSELKHNDDSNGSNFSISYELTAGETYYLVARLYSSDDTGSFNVTVIAG